MLNQTLGPCTKSEFAGLGGRVFDVSVAGDEASILVH